MIAIIQVVGLGLLQTVAILLGGMILGLIKKYDAKKEASVLSFAAAIMIGIAFLDLIFEANDMINEISHFKWYIGAGFLVGLLFMLILEHIVPHEPTRGTQARVLLRSLYKEPKLIRRFLRNKEVTDTVNRNVITELRFLAPASQRLYIEILNHGCITLDELTKNLNIDTHKPKNIIELNEHLSYLQHKRNQRRR